MKRIFYFAAAAFAACAVMVSCDKDDDKKPNNPPTPDPDQPTKLATPSVTCEVGETEVTVSWEAVANAASYEYTVDGGTATTTEETTFTLAVADLAAGNHTVSVTALPEDGSEEYTKSDAGTATFNIEEVQEPITMPDELAPYVGTWSLQTTAYMMWVDIPGREGYVQPEITNEPLNMTVEVAWDEINGMLVMTGLSPLEAVTGPVPIVMGYAEDSNMYIWTNLEVEYDLGQINSQLQGYNLFWQGIADFTEDGYGYSTLTGDGMFNTYTVTIADDGNTMTATGATASAKAKLEDGTVVDLEGPWVAIDLGGVSAQGSTILTADDQSQMPAGDFAFTKTSNSVSAMAAMKIISTELNRNLVASMTVSPMRVR